MDYNVMLVIIVGATIAVLGIILLIVMSRGSKKKTNESNVVNENSPENNTVGYKKKNTSSVAKDDLFNFMEFDKIQDDIIIQQNGEKYTAVIKCKGINYNLMSEIEQLAVEEGFMTFLSTLKYPVQLYVQAQTFDLKTNIENYKENMKSLYEEYDEINAEYSSVLNTLESTDEEIKSVEDKRSSIVNVLEYGQDIVRYVEKLALNKNMLQRNFYVLVSYYKSELSNASSFKPDELFEICYTELFTRVQSIISGLGMCSVAASTLSSNDIAELLYTSYNRDDKNNINVKEALESGFYRLYSTSEDAITKKNRKLVEAIQQEAEYKALKALNRAMEEGNFVSRLDAEEAFDHESSKQALEIIREEDIPEGIKQEAKKIIIDEYKKSKKDRMDKNEQNIRSSRRSTKATVKEENENIISEQHDDVIVTGDNIDTDDDESIV